MRKSSKYLLAGAALVAAVIALRSKAAEKSGSGQGSAGGSDDMLADVPYAGNIAIDSPLANDPYSPVAQQMQYPAPSVPVISVDTATGDRTMPSSGSGGQGLIAAPRSGIFGSGITAPVAATGVLSLLPSFGTEIGKSVAKNIPSMKKPTQAIDAKPEIKAASETFTQKAIKNVPFGEGLAKAYQRLGNTAQDNLAVAALKRTGKTTLALVPFIGTAAGAEFDTRVSGRSRLLSYPANIAGDIAGGIAHVLTLPVAAGVPGDIAAQIAVTEGTYKLYDRIAGKKYVVSDEQKRIGMAMLNPASYIQAGQKASVQVVKQNAPSARASSGNASQASLPITQVSSISSAKGISGSSASTKSVGGKTVVVVKSAAQIRSSQVASVMKYAAATKTQSNKAFKASKRR